MSDEKFRFLELGQCETLPLPVLERLDAAGKEKLSLLSSACYQEIFAKENPVILCGVFFTRTASEGEVHGAFIRTRLPRDDARRLERLRNAKNMLPIGAIWLKTNGNEFGYSLLDIPMRLFPNDMKDKLLTAIHELLRIEYGNPVTMVIEDAFE